MVLATGERLRTGSAAARGGRFFHRYAFGPDLTGMPQVFDTSALMCACLTDSTTSPTMSIVAEIAEG